MAQWGEDGICVARHKMCNAGYPTEEMGDECWLYEIDE
jgi:hypothetical protein